MLLVNLVFALFINKKVISKIKIVISNNKNSNGIDKAKRKNIKTKIINQKEYESKKDFENAYD